MNIAEHIQNIKSKLPQTVALIAVSKTKPISDIIEAYRAGQRIFAENRVQEMTQKYEQLPKDIEWHLIGHLQTNKVKLIANFVSLIHSVDSVSLLKEIDKQAKKCNRIINVLLQFYIAKEETKFGFDDNEAMQMLESDDYKSLKNIQICGVMGMATYTDDEKTVADEFTNLNEIFQRLKKNYFATTNAFKEISMGMSGDYETAIKCGSTMVRIGSLIFGSRY